MNATLQRIAVLPLLLLVPSASAQVIFSRRAYRERGASYQQIWTWNPANGELKELTRSARDHYEPTCDGRMIRFLSPSRDAMEQVTRVRAGSAYSLPSWDRDLWNLNPVTGEETMLGPMPQEREEPVIQTPGCDRRAKLGELEACGNEESLAVSRPGKPVARFQIEVDSCLIDNHGTIGQCSTPIRSLDWAANGRWLLIGEEGLNDSSTSRQNDYYLLNLVTMKLSRVASAETAFWLPGRNQIVYLTPRDMALLPGTRRKRNVWVQRLMFFDPVRGAPTAITSGLANDVDPAWCASAR